MSPRLLALLTGFALAGCSNSWTPDDADGDGFTALQGDCWDAADGPEGSGLAGGDIHPGAAETWYDGVDQDCAVDDDYDADKDGYVPSTWEGQPTAGVPDSGGLPGGDCWDDPASIPEGFAVVPSTLTDKDGTSLAWVQPEAGEVYPGAEDTWYDGVDQDCGGDDDLDRDGDGFRTEAYPDLGGVYGDDCVDGAPLDDDNPAGTASVDVNPDADEVWYDGTDQDCDDNDCDQDGDGWDGGDGIWCVSNECDDTNPAIYPDPDIPEIWYDGADDNCDGNDGDQDGDGYWAADYEALVIASGGTPMAIPTGWEGDCWDVPVAAGGIPAEYEAVNGLPQPDAPNVNPGAVEAWYDDVDQDCSATSDFDQDDDGHDTDAWADREGVVGLDCDDAEAGVNPDASEAWYDGTDDDCDGNDGDRDGDGYWIADYEALVTASGGTPLPVPDGWDGDCDDDDDEVHPDRDEDCATEGVDDDCSGTANDEDATRCTDWFWDADADGHGDETISSSCYCEPVSDWTATVGDDCDDDDAGDHPGATETTGNGDDEDCDGTEVCYDDDDDDGYLDTSGDTRASADTDCTDTYEGTSSDPTTDCDDTAASVHPGASEVVGDGTDQDCNGTEVCYDDDDDDGYLDTSGDTRASADTDCTDTYEGTSSDPTTDCDDTDAGSYPGADEYCDGSDNDCDGTTDEDDAIDASTWYADADGDGYGSASSSDVACDQPPGYAESAGDCDDTSAYAAHAYPGAAEAESSTACMQDYDGDGWGADLPAGAGTTAGDDCDDADADIHPGADEYCNAIDDDCDGETDEDAVDTTTWYLDADGDGDGDDAAVTTVDACDAPVGYAATATDCDDTDDTVHAGATEVEDAIDNDCDDVVDEGFRDEGDVFISEIAYNPAGSEPASEWFEIHNPTAEDLYLDGMSVYSSSSSGRTFYIGVDGLVVPAGGYAVLCYGDAILGALCDYVYGTDVNGPSDAGPTYNGSFSLGNSGPVILTLAHGGTTLDTLSYGTATPWPSSTNGYAIELSATWWDHDSNGTGSSWCRASSTYATGERGTPGSANDSCGYPGIASVTPDEGLVAGGLQVTITGTELAGATAVTFGSDAAVIESATATSLVVTTPAVAASGWVDVTVTDDSASDTLTDAFLFTGDATDVGWCDVSSPLSIATSAGSSTPVYGQVWILGVTEAPGAGAGILGQAGYAPTGSDPRSDPDWTWDDAAWYADDGDNDEYVYDLVLGEGTWAYAWRFSYDGGIDWLYCDAADGTTDGSTPSDPYSVADEATAVITP